MLVLFHSQPFSYTCLSFCCHSDFSGETLHNSHALVCTDQDQQTALQPAQAQQPDTSLPRLEINLRHNATPFSLQPDIYLNLREHWNIEQEVQLVILKEILIRDWCLRLNVYFADHLLVQISLEIAEILQLPTDRNPQA
jgi:hypothetical protein